MQSWCLQFVFNLNLNCLNYSKSH